MAVKKTIKKKTISAKEKKALLEKKTKEALKSVNSLMKGLKNDIIKQFKAVKVKYKDSAIVKKMKKEASSQLRKIAMAIEGKKPKK